MNPANAERLKADESIDNYFDSNDCETLYAAHDIESEEIKPDVPDFVRQCCSN